MTSRYKSLAVTVSIYLACAIVAVVLGMVASVGSLAFTLILAGLIAGPVIMIYPSVLLWVTLAGGLIVSGVVMLYFPQFQVIRWGVAVASMLLVVRALMEGISDRGDAAPRRNLPSLFWWVIAFMLIVIVSSLANWQGGKLLVIGLKSYFQVSGIFFALVIMAWPSRVIERLPKVIFWFAILQLPFVIHEYLFLVPRRAGAGNGVVPADVVAGTFGSSELGGGSNMELSAFMFIVFSVFVSLWKRKYLPLNKLIFISVLLLAPVFVNQSKVSVIFLALVFLTIYKAEFLRQPHKILLPGIFMALIMSGMLYVYALFNATEVSSNPADLVETTIEQNFSSDTGHGAFYLNRWTTITFWFQKHSISDPWPMLIGHGPRATREGGVGLDTEDTFARRMYPDMGIGLTAVSALLWETGAVGLVLVFCIFGSAFRSAGILADRYRDNQRQAAIFSGLQAGVVVMALTLFHKSSFVYNIAYQTIIMLLLGYLAYYLAKDEKSSLGTATAMINKK